MTTTEEQTWERQQEQTLSWIANIGAFMARTDRNFAEVKTRLDGVESALRELTQEIRTMREERTQ